MKNVSTGTGLVALSVAILGSTALVRFGPAEGTAHAAPPMEAGKAIAAAATAQVTPTVVWYQAFYEAAWGRARVLRAWSDGRIEQRAWEINNCQFTTYCNPVGWTVISDPAEGLTYRSDINFDEKVDGADLATLLNDWGNAPRQDIPPSDCPLALIIP
jgi:hypothetical protein